MADINTGFDYLKIAQGARTIPEPPQGRASSATEMAPLFEERETQEPFMREPQRNDDGTAEKVAVETTYRSFSKTFTIWRPWEACNRCGDAIAAQNVVIPSDAGDYECPHTQADEYKETVDRCLRGDGIITTKEVFNMPPPMNTRCAHLEWLEADPEELRKLKRQAEEQKKNQVYPPDVAGAFAKN